MDDEIVVDADLRILLHELENVRIGDAAQNAGKHLLKPPLVFHRQRRRPVFQAVGPVQLKNPVPDAQHSLRRPGTLLVPQHPDRALSWKARYESD